MFDSVRVNLFCQKSFWLAALLMLAAAPARASFADADSELPSAEFLSDPDSTHWPENAPSALAQLAFLRGKMSFQEKTNALRIKSDEGNIIAQDLWGMVLMERPRTDTEKDEGFELVRGAAMKGYVPAMTQLGEIYESDRFFPKDYAAAFHWLNLAAEKGSAEGMLELGACYHYGMGTAPDRAMAFKYYLLSAEHTNYVAMKTLGYVYMNWLGVDKDWEKAKYWSLRAANEGHNRRAMYNLGVDYGKNRSDTNALVESFLWYKKSAELRDAMGCQALASCYNRGWGTETNMEKYRAWLRMAATLGATEAQYRMGTDSDFGQGVPVDHDIAVDWYLKAAKKNHPGALYNLAIHYLNDKSNAASAELSTNYMRRAAEAGNLGAQWFYALGCLRRGCASPEYEVGQQWLTTAAQNGWGPAEYTMYQLTYFGIPFMTNCPHGPANKIEGIQWLRRSAGHNHLPALAMLAAVLLKGTDTDKDSVTAEQLLRKAAATGYPNAENDLGYGLLAGDFPSTDPLAAATWCQLAARSTDPKLARRAQANLANALARLTSDQQAEVVRRADSFQPVPLPQPDPLMKNWDASPAYHMEDGYYGH